MFFREILASAYQSACTEETAMHEHVHLLRDLTRECSSVVEIGLCEMISSWGLLLGLSENTSPDRFYLGIDICEPPKIEIARAVAESQGIGFQFWNENDMHVEFGPTELLFIDSLHTYCHLTYELEKFSPKVSKYIALHDTSGVWENQDDSKYYGDYSEYPACIDRTKRGVWAAVSDFLARHPEWELHERKYNSFGFTILKRRL